MSRAPDLEGSQPGFKSEFFADLYEMEAANFWFRSRNQLIVWVLRRYFQHCKSFLEVGCGSGFVLTAVRERCKHLQVCGSELFSEGLQYARRRLPDVPLLQLDARDMPFLEEYDVIGTFDVLEHIDEDEQVLAELWKVTKYGLVLTVPQHRFLWSALDELGGHKRRYSAPELRSKLEKA
ncbi:MAG: class I SAM-dependent methyltransferase, partial [Terriglobia bacterium]